MAPVPLIMGVKNKTCKQQLDRSQQEIHNSWKGKHIFLLSLSLLNNGFGEEKRHRIDP